MRDKHEHWRRVGDALRALRGLISDRGRLRYFEESLDANELEIALHALCDFLLEPNTPSVSGDVLEQIEGLHSLLQLRDDCIERLRQKASGQ